MTVREAINWVDEVKPNSFTDAVKIGWLNRLEGQLAAEVFLMAPEEIGQLTYTADTASYELLVNPPYDDIYTLWLEAKIDEANGEYNKYQNTMQIYNARLGDFVCWFAQTWDPAEGYPREI